MIVDCIAFVWEGWQFSLPDHYSNKPIANYNIDSIIVCADFSNSNKPIAHCSIVALKICPDSCNLNKPIAHYSIGAVRDWPSLNNWW